MKLKLIVDVTTDDGSAPLAQDIIEKLPPHVNGWIHWNDPSLGRPMMAEVVVLSCEQEE